MAVTALNTGVSIDEVSITRTGEDSWSMSLTGRQVVGTKAYPIATSPYVPSSTPGTESEVNTLIAFLNTRGDNLIEYITGE